MIDAVAFQEAVVRQDADAIRSFFQEDAYINWHCTNEHFTVEEYIRANCEYPGRWCGKVERVEQIDNLMITVTRVYSPDGGISFHDVSFIRLCGDKIASMDEYWGDDGDAPQWRLEKGLGCPIFG